MIKMIRSFRSIFVFPIIACLLFTNISTANAMLSEAASLAITAAEGMLQEDDKKLEQAILKELSDESQKEKLRKYVENTRPMIKEKSKFFNDIITPAFAWVMQEMPSVGNVLMGTVVNVYIMHYESKLDDNADSDMLKKFAELRENNIEAGQGIFETMMDLYDPSYNKNSSTLSLVADSTLIFTKGKQYYDRYTSSAGAIATVLEAAGIPMSPEDVGDICSNQWGITRNNTSPKPQSITNTQTSTNKAASSSQINTSSKANNSYTSNASIGNIRLDESMANTNKKLGNPNKKTVKDDGKINCEYNTMDISFSNDKIIGIAVDDKNISTPKGLHSGSALQDVLNAYGSNYMLSTYDDLDLYEYEYRDDNGRIYYLRFAVKQASGLVKYISIRYVD